MFWTLRKIFMDKGQLQFFFDVKPWSSFPVFFKAKLLSATKKIVFFSESLLGFLYPINWVLKVSSFVVNCWSGPQFSAHSNRFFPMLEQQKQIVVHVHLVSPSCLCVHCPEPVKTLFYNSSTSWINLSCFVILSTKSKVLFCSMGFVWMFNFKFTAIRGFTKSSVTSVVFFYLSRNRQ